MKGWIAAILLLAACGSAPLKPMPEKVGAWSIESTSGTSPQVISYRGPVPVTVTIHEYPSDTSAFEAFQKWRVEPGTLPFYQGRRLFVPAASDKVRLGEFVLALQPLVR
jgi:hypothetical protein